MFHLWVSAMGLNNFVSILTYLSPYKSLARAFSFTTADYQKLLINFVYRQQIIKKGNIIIKTDVKNSFANVLSTQKSLLSALWF